MEMGDSADVHQSSSHGKQFLELIEILKSRSEFAFLSEWQKGNVMPVEVQDSDLCDAIFDFLQKYDKTSSTIEAILIEEQKKTNNVTGLFREDTVGVSLLVLLWTRKEGKLFMENVIVPVVDQIIALDHPLELDSKKSKRVNRNFEELQKYLSQLLNGIAASENYLSRDFKQLIRNLGNELSIRFPEANLSGLICLRMITPVLVSPQKYVSKYSSVPSDAQRSLLLMGKVIQKLANGMTFEKHEAIMFPCNRFIKRNLRTWLRISHKLVTGEDIVTEETQVIEIDGDDLFFGSNMELLQDEKNEYVIGKQRELINRLLAYEKQPDWKMQMHGEMNVGFHKYEKGKVLTKAIVEIQAPLNDVFLWIRDKRNTKESDHMIQDIKDLERVSDKMRIVYKLTKPPMMDPREMVFLEYADILPEDNFAVVFSVSVDFDVKPAKGALRAEVFAGFIMRQTKTCVTLTFIFHSDGKGIMSKLPKSLAKKACVYQSTILLKCKEKLEAREV